MSAAVLPIAAVVIVACAVVLMLRMDAAAGPPRLAASRTPGPHTRIRASRAIGLTTVVLYAVFALLVIAALPL